MRKIKRQVRRNIFETNSSSVHTLTIHGDGMKKSDLQINDDGYIYVPFLSITDEECVLKTQTEKLSYLMTCCHYLVKVDSKWNKTPFYESYKYEHINEAVCKYTGAKGVRVTVDVSPYIPDKYAPEYEYPIINEWVPESIQNFIFNDYISINPNSEHHLVIDKSGREPNRMRVYKDGNCLKVRYGKFDRYDEIFFTQYEKLSYLMTCCWYLAGWPNDVEDVYDSSYYKHIRDAVCKYVGCDTIRIVGKDEPYIDHQSAPYNGIELVDIYDDDAIIDFVFNKYISLHTTSD